MAIRPRARDALWMALGAALLALGVLLVLLFGREPTPNAELASRAQRMDSVRRMQLGLASASEAEKSAVLAIADEESQAFADRARASTSDVERERQELMELLSRDGTPLEQDLLAEFSRRFTEFRRIDDELLSLAAEDTNLKAYALAFGPAMNVLDELSAALSRLVVANADSPQAAKVTSLAFGAETGALRIQTLLAPHIAEPSDQRMDELEARMAREDDRVQSALEALRALPKLDGADDLAVATSRYARFREIESQVLALSRENTNVRSLSISLNRKRKVMLECHETLGKLQEAIRTEPIEGATYGGRIRVR
jgi:hypothetical protein